MFQAYVALSRSREFLADAGSAELTKDPDALIRALHKIERHAAFDVSSRIGAAFQTLASERADALYISADPIFYSYRNEIASLSARHGLPAISGDRDFAQAGGLSSYGASRSDAYRQAGLYVVILKGEKPSDLPVVQPTRFELLINLKTARGLGLVVGPTVLASADDIIE